jgi:diguanylate cyclase (GGDEF)-like protein
MLDAAVTPPGLLDVPTLIFAAACVAAFLGAFLIFNWVQQRDVRALAWWGSAYLVGAAAIALWRVSTPLITLAPVWAEAMMFVACGMFWNGVRLFHGRKLWPMAPVAGAAAWLMLCQLPGVAEGSRERIALGVALIAFYSFFIAFELSRERRRAPHSRAAAVALPMLYAGIFLVPVGMQVFVPDFFASRWLTVLALEAIIYAVGTAFIVMLMVKDRHVHFYRTAATTDSLTGLLNRGAFLEAAKDLQARQGKRGEPVTLLMFDLDHFKSVNDRFGHATGDSVLRLFAQVAQKSMRATDVLGRLGGEEFVAMVPEPMEGAIRVAERLRATFQEAGVTVDGHAIGATVSSGLATSRQPEPDIGSLLVLADTALYRAKNEGRNRFCCADENPDVSLADAAADAALEAVLAERKYTPRPEQAPNLALAG